MLFRGLLKKSSTPLEQEEQTPATTMHEDSLNFEDINRHVDNYAKDCDRANQEYLQEVERKALNIINKAKKNIGE